MDSEEAEAHKWFAANLAHDVRAARSVVRVAVDGLTLSKGEKDAVFAQCLADVRFLRFEQENHAAQSEVLRN